MDDWLANARTGVPNTMLRYVHIGVGGWGQHWCTAVLPRLKSLGLAEAAGAVDINRC